MTRQLVQWMARRPLYQQVLAGLAVSVLGAELLAPAIWYAVAGEVPATVHIVAILTAALISLPLWYLFTSISNLLGQSEEQAARANRAARRKNEIFRTLLRASLELHKSDELSDLLQRMLGHLREIFPGHDFGVIVEGQRPSMIRYIASHGISEAEKQVLIEHNEHLLRPEAGEIAAALRDILPEKDAGRGNHWYFLPLQGRAQHPLGKLAVKGPELDEADRELITLFVEQLATATENKLLSQALERLANTDGLTGVYNRAWFKQELDRRVRMKRDNPSVDFCLILIDLNSLKRINDEFGHAEGDRTIVATARMLTRVCRQEDLICRIGGDEFVVLCPGTTARHGEQLVERIRERAAETALDYTADSGKRERLALSLSTGTACTSELEPEQVFKAADDRMYADKSAYYRRPAEG